MPDIKIALRGDRALREVFYGGGLYRIAANGYVRRMRKVLLDNLYAFAPKDTEALAKSFSATVNPSSATVTSMSAYVRPVEEGRRAGATAPPMWALLPWYRRHGSNNNSGKSVARDLFIIARTIGQRGIKGRFFIRKAIVASNKAIPRIVDECIQDINNRFLRRV